MTAMTAIMTEPVLPQDEAEQLIDRMIADAGLKRKQVYFPGEVQRILRIGTATFARICNNWPTDPNALENFRISTHRRVTHAALVNWMAINHAYSRNG